VGKGKRIRHSNGYRVETDHAAAIGGGGEKEDPEKKTTKARLEEIRGALEPGSRASPARSSSNLREGMLKKKKGTFVQPRNNIRRDRWKAMNQGKKRSRFYLSYLTG